MANFTKKYGSGSRDLGLSTGAGKGDTDRVSDRAAFNANFDEIDWGRNKVTPADPNAAPEYVNNPDGSGLRPFVPPGWFQVPIGDHVLAGDRREGLDENKQWIWREAVPFPGAKVDGGLVHIRRLC